MVASFKAQLKCQSSSTITLKALTTRVKKLLNDQSASSKSTPNFEELS